jgi:Rv2525c-like, glycoside hydrolase-like domain
LKLTKMAPIFPGLLLAACHSPPSPPAFQAIELPRKVGPGQGIDLATDASDVLNELRASRVDFVARYYREPESRWPALSPSEAKQLSSAGLKIVAVWESHSRKPVHFTYSSGFNDAMTAYRQARAIGQPAGSAIYFAVDFDAKSRLLASIDDYFRGIGAGLAAASGGSPDYTIGVYGSGAVCDALKRAGLAQYSWLSHSIAWTGSIGYEDWNIRQGGRLPELSFNHDADEARDEYGAFRVGNYNVATSYNGAAPP